MKIILRTLSDVFIFNLGLRFEGLFWKRYILKGRIVFEGHSKTSILNTAVDQKFANLRRRKEVLRKAGPGSFENEESHFRMVR